MSYLRISEARAAGQAARSYVSKSASQILTEDARSFSPARSYDVFLSHAYEDGELILGVKKIIEGLGLSVYVDWIDDAGLDRGKVTSRTAQLLREQCAHPPVLFMFIPQTQHSRCGCPGS